MSAGSWDGTRRAVRLPGHQQRGAGAHDRQRPSARIEREIRGPELDEILNPSWSPDVRASRSGAGRRAQRSVRLRPEGIAVEAADERCVRRSGSGVVPGQPPDRVQHRPFLDAASGDRDRRSALAIIDAATGAVREAGGFTGAENISPQWSADGRSLFFLSDRQGITNIYRGVDRRRQRDGHQPAHRRQRYHRQEPGRSPWRRIGSSSAPTRTTATIYARHRRADRRRPDREPAEERSGAHAADNG